MNRTEAKNKLVEFGLTAEEAETLIEKAEKENCEPTSRLQPDWDTTVEFQASASFDGVTGVSVYYYPEKEELDYVAEEFDGDLSYIMWQITKYEVY